MSKMKLLIVLLCLFAFAPVSGALADYYKYTDSRGVVSITNTLDSVPAKYRSTVKVITDDSLAKKDAGARKQLPQSESASAEPAAAAQQAETNSQASAPAPEGKFQELSARFPWFKPLVYLVAFVALLVAVIKLTSLVPSPILSKLIYVAFFMGVFVFIYKSYVEHVAESSRNIKEQAATIMKKSTVREELPQGEAAANPVQKP